MLRFRAGQVLLRDFSYEFEDDRGNGQKLRESERFLHGHSTDDAELKSLQARSQ